MSGLDLPDWNAAMKDTLERAFHIQVGKQGDLV